MTAAKIIDRQMPERKTPRMLQILRFVLVAFPLMAGRVASTAEIPKMVITTGVDPGFSIFYVAIKAGILTKHGVDAELKTGPSGGAMVPLVISDQANAAMSAVLAGLNNHLVDANVVAVAQVNTYEHFYGIVSLKSIAAVKDLKGHKVGIARGTASEALWYAALNHFHLNPADYASSIVYVEPPEMLAAIERHDIDAYSSWEPWISRTLLAEPNTHLLLDNHGIMPDLAFIYMNRRWIEKNRDAAKKFMQGMVESAEFIRDKPKEMKEIVGNFVNLSPQLMDSIVPKLTFTLKLDQQSYDYAKIQVDQLKDRGRIKGDFGYGTFFYPDLLKEVAPARVDLPKEMPG
jgi:ABC-type nitrate/sulfonate/bicarbonate transport system substrate-binding protein